MQRALLSSSGLFQALTPTLAVRSSHNPDLLRLKGRIKAWEGTDKMPAAANPTCPAPGTATLGKPQLWAEGTRCESIAGSERGAGSRWMYNSLSVLVETGAGVNTEGWQCWEFLGCSWGVGEHNSLFNPSDMTGKGQSHCLDPKSSCPGKGDALVQQRSTWLCPALAPPPPGGQAQQGLALLPTHRHCWVVA